MMRVLVMGLGRGLAIAEAAAGVPGLSLAGVIDSAHARLEQARQVLGLADAQFFTDFHQALTETKSDLLIVATPTRLHAEHTRAGLRAGLHVLCEKPLCLSWEDAVALSEEAHRTGRRLAVVQNMRFAAPFRRCHELLREGVIGRLHTVELRFRRWRQVQTLQHAHAVLFNHGVHHLDLIRFLTGAVPKAIQAHEWDPPEVGAGKGACLRMTALTEDGFTVGYDASYAETGEMTPHTGELRLTGSRGSLHVAGEPDINPQVWLTQNAAATGQEQRHSFEVIPISVPEMDRAVLENFTNAIQAGTPAETDIEDNVHTLEWLFQVAQVIDQNRTRRVPCQT